MTFLDTFGLSLDGFLLIVVLVDVIGLALLFYVLVRR